MFPFVFILAIVSAQDELTIIQPTSTSIWTLGQSASIQWQCTNATDTDTGLVLLDSVLVDSTGRTFQIANNLLVDQNATQYVFTLPDVPSNVSPGLYTVKVSIFSCLGESQPFRIEDAIHSSASMASHWLHATLFLLCT